MSTRAAVTSLVIVSLGSAALSRIWAADTGMAARGLANGNHEPGIIIIDDIGAPVPYEVVNPRESEGLVFYVTSVQELREGTVTQAPDRLVIPDGEPLAGVILWRGNDSDWPHEAYPGLPMVHSWYIDTSPPQHPFLVYRTMLRGYYAPGPVDVRFQGTGSLAFSRCVSGPEVVPAIPSCLEAFDTDLDDDVDLVDYGEYQRLIQ